MKNSFFVHLALFFGLASTQSFAASTALSPQIVAIQEALVEFHVIHKAAHLCYKESFLSPSETPKYFEDRVRKSLEAIWFLHQAGTRDFKKEPASRLDAYAKAMAHKCRQSLAKLQDIPQMSELPRKEAASRMFILSAYEYLMRPEVRENIAALNKELASQFLPAPDYVRFIFGRRLCRVKIFRNEANRSEEEVREVQVLTLLQIEHLVDLVEHHADLSGSDLSLTPKSYFERILLPGLSSKIVDDYKAASQTIRDLPSRAYRQELLKERLFAELSDSLEMFSHDLVNLVSLFVVDRWTLMHQRLLDAQAAARKELTN